MNINTRLLEKNILSSLGALACYFRFYQSFVFKEII